MGVTYTQLDLRDILTNKRALTVMPIISSVAVTRYRPNYHNQRTKTGRLPKVLSYKEQSTDYKLIILNQLVNRTRRVARSSYSQLSVTKTATGDITVSGQLKYSLNRVYQNVLNGLSAQGNIKLLQSMATNAPIMAEVFKQIEKNKPRDLGEDPEEYMVWVRASTVASIAKMRDIRTISGIEQDIIDSIMFGTGFKQAREALGFNGELFKSRTQHAREMWLKKITQK